MKLKLLLSIIVVVIVVCVGVFMFRRNGAQSVTPQDAASSALKGDESSVAPPGDAGRPDVNLAMPPEKSAAPDAPTAQPYDLPLGAPTADNRVTKLVPPDLTEKIGEKAARDTWGEVAMGPPLTCCDENGDVVGYQFACAIGADAFPAYADILASVQEGRKIQDGGFEAMSQQERNALLQRVTADAKKRQPPPPAGVGSDFFESEAEEVALEIGRQRSIGEGQYGTVLVSARYDLYPVPLISHYLPPYFYNGDRAAQAAATALSAQKATLTRIFLIDGGHDQYFEFSDGKSRVLVHCFSLEVHRPEEILKRRGGVRAINAKDVAELKREWEKFTREAQ